MKRIDSLDIKDKKVLIRCDLNVPIKNGRIQDAFKIEKSLETLRYLSDHDAKTIIISHLGRPKRRDSSLSLSLVREELERLLGKSVLWSEKCVGRDLKKKIDSMDPGDIILLENIRFYKQEERNGRLFAKKLARLGDVYVNDALASSHRRHASIISLPTLMPSVSGLLLDNEIKELSRILNDPRRPVVGLIGGSKIEKKTEPIPGLLENVDQLLIGGLVGQTLKDRGFKHDKVTLPSDGIIEGRLIDIGPSTVDAFTSVISEAKTVIWAGPMGDTRYDEYAEGTRRVAQSIIDSGAFSIIGGGDTVQFIRREGMYDKFNHVSTGGSAMLQFLATGTLPGIEVLERCTKKI